MGQISLNNIFYLTLNTQHPKIPIFSSGIMCACHMLLKDLLTYLLTYLSS